MKKLLVWLMAGFVALSLTACWESETENKMEDVGEAVESTASDIQEAAQDAGQEVQEAAEEVQEAAEPQE